MQHHHSRCFWNNLNGGMIAFSMTKKLKIIFAQISLEEMGEESIALKAANKTQQTVGHQPAWSFVALSLPCFSPPFYLPSTFPIWEGVYASPPSTFPEPALDQHTGKNLLLLWFSNFIITSSLSSQSFSPRGTQPAWLHLIIQTLLLKCHTFADS